MGYCIGSCEGVNPASILLGFSYNAAEVQFVFYVTEDAMNDPADANSGTSAEVNAWRDSYFTWIDWYPVQGTEPSDVPPSSEELYAILNGMDVQIA